MPVLARRIRQRDRWRRALLTEEPVWGGTGVLSTTVSVESATVLHYVTAEALDLAVERGRPGASPKCAGVESVGRVPWADGWA
jgi:hypothetical protein